jgi:hypothetical protein
MRTAVTAIQMIVRLCFLILLILGILFWTGHALNLIQVHMTVGIILVLGLWITSIIAAITRAAPAGMVAAGLIWGFVVIALGMSQFNMLPGPTHWIVQVTHLLVGMAAIALNERLATRTLQQLPATG